MIGTRGNTASARPWPARAAVTANRVALAIMMVLLIGFAGWLSRGTVQLGEYSGSATSVFGVDRWPVARFTATANGLHRLEIRVFTREGSDRGLLLRLRDSAAPDRDLAVWSIAAVEDNAYLAFEMPPISDSAGKTYLVQAEPAAGAGLPPLISASVTGPTLSALGTGVGTGLELRRYYETTPLTWLTVMAGRVGPGVLVAAAIYLLLAIVVVRLVSGRSAVIAALVAVLCAGLFGLVQSSAASATWAAAPSSPPDSGKVAVDLVPLLGTPAIVERGIVAADRSAYIGSEWVRLNDEWRPVIYTHPPAIFDASIVVPANGRLRYGIALRPEVWDAAKGDGVLFEVWLRAGNDSTTLMSDYVDPKNEPADRRWLDRDVDLAPWAGQRVTISFRTGAGPRLNEDFDFALWGRPVVVTR